MNSVERIKEYVNIEQEPPAVIDGHRPPTNVNTYFFFLMVFFFCLRYFVY